MIVFARAQRQLDDRGRLFEYLPAAVEHEVVVRGHLAVDD